MCSSKIFIFVHGGHIFSKLTARFWDETLAHTQSEVAPPKWTVDVFRGVLMDCLSEFWQEFYDQSTPKITMQINRSLCKLFMEIDYSQQQLIQNNLQLLVHYSSFCITISAYSERF